MHRSPQVLEARRVKRVLAFHGQNAECYNSRESEVLLAGPAGTGKSFVLLAKVLTLLGKYPGCRILFCRGTRTSLTQSGLVTFEEKILGPKHPVLMKNPVKRRVRQSYEFDNGSELVVAGLDDPGKTLSSEYDACYIQEATEEGITLDVYETLLRSLRNGKTPFTQLMSDCNPTSPVSFLWRRQHAGVLKMYSSTHKDNPMMWDRQRGEWTEAGRAYLANLERMSGPRRKRFLEGLWVVAEGLVFSEYNPGVHLLPHGWRCPPDWRRVWSIDWGKNAPSVLQVWAVDPDARMHLVREVYKPRQRGSDLGRAGRRLIDVDGEPEPLAVVCDHDDEKKSTFEAESHLSLTFADKTDRDAGFGQVSDRLDLANDDRPRLYFARDARRHEPDEGLLNEGKPTCTLDEIVGYVWDTKNAASGKDEPIAFNDHGMDAMRYAVRHVDTHLLDRGSDGGYGTPTPSASSSGW
jgi:hypothetical protein